jgi:hypothetical protein
MRTLAVDDLIYDKCALAMTHVWRYDLELCTHIHVFHLFAAMTFHTQKLSTAI